MVPGSDKDPLTLGFERVHVDGQLGRPFDALLRVVASFYIAIDGEYMYSEEQFCVVELAAQLARWLTRGLQQEADFVYTSEESDVQGLLRIESIGSDQWHLSAYDLARGERRVLGTPLSTEAVRGAVRRFVKKLLDQLPERARVLRFLAEEGEDDLLALFGELSNPSP